MPSSQCHTACFSTQAAYSATYSFSHICNWGFLNFGTVTQARHKLLSASNLRKALQCCCPCEAVERRTRKQAAWNANSMRHWQPSPQMRCSSEIMQATCQEKFASLSRESWLRSLCVIVIIPIDPIWYFSWGLPQRSGLLCTMMNARRHLAPHTVHHPHDLYIDQHRSSNPHPFLSPSKSMIILVVKVVFEDHLFPMNFLPLAWLEQ